MANYFQKVKLGCHLNDIGSVFPHGIEERFGVVFGPFCLMAMSKDKEVH